MTTNRIRRLVPLGLAVLAPLLTGAALRAPELPEREWAMIRQIAANYDLTEEQTWLLAAIRCHENGRPGLEFGVGGHPFRSHVAHRYEDGFKSFYVQGSWAAGTIRRHYRGDLAQFGRRYCPESARQWSNGVRSLIERLKTRHKGRLPGVAYPKRKVPFLQRGSERRDQ